MIRRIIANMLVWFGLLFVRAGFYVGQGRSKCTVELEVCPYYDEDTCIFLAVFGLPLFYLFVVVMFTF